MRNTSGWRPRQAARAFFEACAKEDWDEAGKFYPGSVSDRMKQYLGGLKILQIGEPFQSKGYPGWFVPSQDQAEARGARQEAQPGPKTFRSQAVHCGQGNLGWSDLAKCYDLVKKRAGDMLGPDPSYRRPCRRLVGPN